ncbi:MAG TPA: hypothetical protein VD793_11085, partial [Gemmatimonadales bacterium]|nr:hypothetical protein [Gemmatimonadales bacterium]
MSGDPAGVFLRALVSAGDGEVGATRLAARFGIEGWVRNRLGRLGDSPPAVHLAAQLRHQLLVEAAGQASACLA